jgi:hypothetical protein
MPRPAYIALHALAAAGFVFLLQTVVLRTPIETGLIWALVFGLGAAGLAWHQSNR